MVPSKEKNRGKTSSIKVVVFDLEKKLNYMDLDMNK